MAEHLAEEKNEGRAITQSEAYTIARNQQLLAVDGLAENQCGYCGAYRLDGMPPTIHQPWCAVPHRRRA